MQYIPYLAAFLLAMLIISGPLDRGARIAVFLIPWWALEVDFGVSFKMSEFLMLVYVLRAAIAGQSLTRFSRNRIGLFLLFFLYSGVVAAITILFGPEVPEFAGGSIFRNGFGRVFSVGVKWGILIAFMIAVTRLKASELPSILLAYVRSCVILASLGLLQMITFLVSGIDLFPVGIFLSEDYQYQGTLNIGGAGILRVSSFGGEPKGLGVALAIAIYILWATKDLNHISPLRQKLYYALMLLVVILTASTSAFIVLGSIFVYILVFRFLGASLSTRTLAIALTAQFIVITAVFISFAESQSNGSQQLFVSAETYLDALTYKLTGRLHLDDTDAYLAQSFARDRLGIIFGRGLGVVHHYGYDLIPTNHLERLGGTILSAKSGVIELLGNGGMIGGILFMVAIANFSSNSSPHLSLAQKRTVWRFQAVTMGFLLAFLLRLYAPEIILLSVLLFGEYTRRAYIRPSHIDVVEGDIENKQKSTGIIPIMVAQVKRRRT